MALLTIRIFVNTDFFITSINPEYPKNNRSLEDLLTIFIKIFRESISSVAAGFQGALHLHTKYHEVFKMCLESLFREKIRKT